MFIRPTLIAPANAHEYLASGKAVAVDARPYADYALASEQLPAAVHIDPESGVAMDRLIEQLPQDKLLLFYCDEPANQASVQMALRARALGRRDASVLDGGLRGWMRAGFGTEPRPETDGPIALGELLPPT
jgi:rhodanese-related sulfurtransferase